MVLVLIASVAFSMALCALLTLLMRGLARRIGFVDRPGGHKTHDRPTAQGGGIAIFCTLAAVLIAGVWGAKWLLAAGHTQWAPEALRPHLPGIAGKWPMVLAVLGGALVLHVVGLIDDVRPLRALPKFVAQVVVATVLVVGFDIRAATALGPVVSSGATVLWLVVVINAFNFLDNIDGLSAGVAAITASIFACSATLAGQLFVPAMAWVLVGKVCAKV